MEEFIFPTRIVDVKSESDVRILLKKQPLQIGLSEQKAVAFSEGDHVILDFGKEMCGSVRILTHRSNTARIRIRLGESLGEVYSDLGGKQNATSITP